jgi:uncharacterized Zn finger protein
MARASSSTLFTENNLHNWVGEAQFSRGMQYVRDGLVIPHRRSGRYVSGWCLPRDGQRRSYFVTARGNGVRVTEARCTCPLGKHGFCPHVAAVLFTYLRRPADFHRSWWQRLKARWTGVPTSAAG